MKSSQPPALAIWLLEHLAPGGKNDALTGDLLEDFGRRGSVVWYWRQVFMAILVGCAKELRTRWMGIAFTIIYTCSSVILWRQIWSNIEFQSLFYWGLKLAWPVSLIYQTAFLTLLDAVVLLVGLSVYLGATRSFNVLKFSKKLFVALLVLSLGNIGGAFLPVLGLPAFFSYILWRLPLFLGLVVAMCIACPSAARTEATKLPV